MRSAIEKYGMRIKQEQFNNDPEFTNTTTIKRVTGLTFNELKQKCNGKINNASQNVYFEDINAFTQEEAYVVGVIIGDGYVGDEIYLGAIDKDFVIEFAKNLCKLLSLKWDGWDAKNTEICCMGPIKKENYESYGHDQWRVSKGITNRVENYFKLYQNLSGEDYFNLLEEFQWYKRDLIRGLWDSEGSISTETGKLRFSNSNYYVLHLFMQLVSDVINIDYENSKNTDGSKENYKSEYYGEFTVSPPVNPDNKTRVVTIPSKYREKFFKKINPTIRRKRELFEKHIINKNRSKFHSTYKGREFNGEGVFDNLINQKT